MIKINLIKAERILSKTQIDIADYVINPYRGCEYGCIYCYAKGNKNIKNKKNLWGKFVDVKINAPEKLEQELKNITYPIKKILIGSTTEIFQPIENKYKLMYYILKILKTKNIPFVILTKSTLIEKYIKLLNYSPENEIYFTINTDEIKKLFEPISPPQNSRIKTIIKLINAGIKINIYISPFFPFLSNYKEIFDLIKNIPYKDRVGLYFESYNIKAGNWKEIEPLLNTPIKNKFLDIYKSESKYNEYWDTIKKEIKEYNTQFKFKLKFFIYPYNNYYNFFSYKNT